MATNLDCVGLSVADRDALRHLLGTALDTAEVVGERGDLVLYRWQDPSGSRLLISAQHGTVVDFLPSFAATPGARLTGIQAANDQVAIADVVDGDGAQVTRLAAEFEQRRLLPVHPVDGAASIVALGVDITVHASVEAFAESDASLLNPTAHPVPPPPEFVENGWQWPPRMAAESFISYGVFNTGDAVDAYARFNGVVRSSEVRTVAATGQRFVTARVGCAGFEAAVCLPAETDPPSGLAPGNVVAGTVFLVASVPDWSQASGSR